MQSKDLGQKEGRNRSYQREQLFWQCGDETVVTNRASGESLAPPTAQSRLWLLVPHGTANRLGEMWEGIMNMNERRRHSSINLKPRTAHGTELKVLHTPNTVPYD
jgi:hypothetical protein